MVPMGNTAGCCGFQVKIDCVGAQLEAKDVITLKKGDGPGGKIEVCGLWVQDYHKKFFHKLKIITFVFFHTFIKIKTTQPSQSYL